MSRLANIVAVAVIVAIGIAAVTLYPNVAQKARLAADQGTVEAMRSAIAIYYGQHATFPDHPGNYVSPTPPSFQCVNLAYNYSSITGGVEDHLHQHV